MPEKVCRECNATLPLSHYYKHPKMSDGRLGKCKECVKTRVRAHRAANIERIRERDRNRPGAAERSKRSVKANREKYRRDPEFKKRVKASKARWASKNARKRKAQIITGNAIRGGKLKRLPCEVCRTTENVDAHHEDYRFPLDVRWLCRVHHMARHREINEAMRAGANLRHKGFSLSEAAP